MDIEKLSLQELYKLWRSEVKKFEMSQNNIRLLDAEINKREEAEAKKKEK